MRCRPVKPWRQRAPRCLRLSRAAAAGSPERCARRSTDRLSSATWGLLLCPAALRIGGTSGSVTKACHPAASQSKSTQTRSSGSGHERRSRPWSRAARASRRSSWRRSPGTGRHPRPSSLQGTSLPPACFSGRRVRLRMVSEFYGGGPTSDNGANRPIRRRAGTDEVNGPARYRELSVGCPTWPGGTAQQSGGRRRRPSSPFALPRSSVHCRSRPISGPGSRLSTRCEPRSLPSGSEGSPGRRRRSWPTRIT